ncbi:hypothetical protein F5887DRAFT_1080600 [Amanita rubescens]|nr:hypothetical protein F5887DRAFT_1080600 [Amanita rubescens]
MTRRVPRKATVHSTSKQPLNGEDFFEHPTGKVSPGAPSLTGNLKESSSAGGFFDQLLERDLYPGITNEEIINAISATEAASELKRRTRQKLDTTPMYEVPTRLRENVTPTKKAPPEIVRAFDARKQRVRQELAMNSSTTADLRSASIRARPAVPTTDGFDVENKMQRADVEFASSIAARREPEPKTSALKACDAPRCVDVQAKSARSMTDVLNVEKNIMRVDVPPPTIMPEPAIASYSFKTRFINNMPAISAPTNTRQRSLSNTLHDMGFVEMPIPSSPAMSISATTSRHKRSKNSAAKDTEESGMMVSTTDAFSKMGNKPSSSTKDVASGMVVSTTDPFSKMGNKRSRRTRAAPETTAATLDTKPSELFHKDVDVLANVVKFRGVSTTNMARTPPERFATFKAVPEDMPQTPKHDSGAFGPVPMSVPLAPQHSTTRTASAIKSKQERAVIINTLNASTNPNIPPYSKILLWVPPELGFLREATFLSR